MSARLVSVVIAVRDGERYLRQAVRSVLAQTHQPLEVIVVDDGSVDGTGNILRDLEHGVRSVRQQRSGMNAALNRGVGMARGEFLAFVDADDLWTDGKLELQMSFLETKQEFDMVFGHVRHFHTDDLSEGERNAIACPLGAMPGKSAGTMLVRRESFDRVGLFGTEWRVGGFIDWYARADEQGLTSEMLPEVVMLRRVHGGNMTLGSPEARVDYARIARAALRRRHER